MPRLRPRFRPAAVAVGLLVALVAVTGPAHAMVASAPSAPRPPALRILLTGDSITHGFHGDYTWRYRFAKEFTRQGTPVDFVGSRSTPYLQPGWRTSTYAEPDFDSNHFALGATTLRKQADVIGAEVAGQRPDVIVLACGINDLRYGATPAQTESRLRSWLVAVRKAKPDVRIIISPVLDAIDPTRPWLHRAILDYNALVARSAPELSTDVSPVTLADTTRGWSARSLTTDDIHPTPTAETLIAQRIAETFHKLGYLAGPPQIYHGTAWNRVARVQASIRNQRAVLTWDHQSISGARISMRRVGHAARLLSTSYRGGRTTTSRLVRRASYEFRVQFVRGRIRTPLGPVTRITVRAPSRPGAVASVVVSGSGVRWSRSAAASHYVVKYRRAQAHRWVTRRTSGLSISATNAQRARVWAVNAAGRSPVRSGAR